MNEYMNEITLLKALSHPARLAILEALRQGEACVCHLEALFGWRQAYLSQQLMVLRAAGLADAGDRFGREASMAKLFASEAAARATAKAVQIHGGYGFIKDYAVERYYRDVKLTEIGEGTSEVQRAIIAREVLRRLGGGAS